MVRLGNLLYRQRVRKKLTLNDIEKAIKIKSSFLSAIEKGEYHKLPSPAYAKGFVTNYAAYLGIPRAEAVALFRREFDEKRAYKVLPDSLTNQQVFPFRIKIKESFLLLTTLVILFLGFMLFQYRSTFLPPALSVTSPQDGAVITQDITVIGTTDSEATLTINNEAVSVDNKGEFVKKLTLFPGKEEIVIKAKNRFGKETVVTREIVVK